MENGLLGSHSAVLVRAQFRSKESYYKMSLFSSTSTAKKGCSPLLRNEHYSTYQYDFPYFLLKEDYIFTFCQMGNYSTFYCGFLHFLLEEDYFFTFCQMRHFLQHEALLYLLCYYKFAHKTLNSKENAHQVDVSSQHVSTHIHKYTYTYIYSHILHKIDWATRFSIPTLTTFLL